MNKDLLEVELLDIEPNTDNQLFIKEKKNIIIAYEPVWSIGTGLIPTNKNLQKIEGKTLLQRAIEFSNSIFTDSE